MKRIIVFLLSLSLLTNCNLNQQNKRNNLSQDSLVPEKNTNLLTKEVKFMSNSYKALEYFYSHMTEIKRNEIDLSWMDSMNTNPDREALLFESEKFNVLQITNYGTLGKKETNLFSDSQNIFHIRQIDFRYNHPYDLPDLKIVKSDTLDFFLENKEISTIKLNGKIVELDEKLKRDGYSILSEGKKIFEKTNRETRINH